MLSVTVALQVMPTIISSCSIWYSQLHHRWLSARELPTLQGFPVLPSMSYNKSCCSFAQRERRTSSSEAAPLVDWPSRGQICKMSGNTMHCNVSGAIMMFVWTQVLMDVDLLQVVRGLQQQTSNRASAASRNRVIRSAPR